MTLVACEAGCEACRTRELSAEQKFTRDHWRKQNPPVCAAKFREIFGTRDEKLSKFRRTRKNLLTPIGTSDC